MRLLLPRVQIREHVCIWPWATGINLAADEGVVVSFPTTLACQGGSSQPGETRHVPRRSRPPTRNMNDDTPSAHHRMMPAPVPHHGKSEAGAREQGTVPSSGSRASWPGVGVLLDRGWLHFASPKVRGRPKVRRPKVPIRRRPTLAISAGLHLARSIGRPESSWRLAITQKRNIKAWVSHLTARVPQTSGLVRW